MNHSRCCRLVSVSVQRRGGEEALARERDGPIYLSTDLEMVAIKGVEGGVSIMAERFLWWLFPFCRLGTYKRRGDSLGGGMGQFGQPIRKEGRRKITVEKIDVLGPCDLRKKTKTIG